MGKLWNRLRKNRIVRQLRRIGYGGTGGSLPNGYVTFDASPIVFDGYYMTMN